jgi:hypothetical protein
VNPEQAISAEALRVANVHETVVVLASLAGVDVSALKSSTFTFDKSGDVTFEVVSTDGSTDSGTLKAADILKANMIVEEAEEAAEGERPSIPPPAMPVG